MCIVHHHPETATDCSTTCPHSASFRIIFKHETPINRHTIKCNYHPSLILLMVNITGKLRVASQPGPRHAVVAPTHYYYHATFPAKAGIISLCADEPGGGQRSATLQQGSDALLTGQLHITPHSADIAQQRFHVWGCAHNLVSSLRTYLPAGNHTP